MHPLTIRHHRGACHSSKTAPKTRYLLMRIVLLSCAFAGSLAVMAWRLSEYAAYLDQVARV